MENSETVNPPKLQPFLPPFQTERKINGIKESCTMQLRKQLVPYSPRILLSAHGKYRQPENVTFRGSSLYKSLHDTVLIACETHVHLETPISLA